MQNYPNVHLLILRFVNLVLFYWEKRRREESDGGCGVLGRVVSGGLSDEDAGAESWMRSGPCRPPGSA